MDGKRRLGLACTDTASDGMRGTRWLVSYMEKLNRCGNGGKRVTGAPTEGCGRRNAETPQRTPTHQIRALTLPLERQWVCQQQRDAVPPGLLYAT
jgi:hypothetical protein